MPSTLVIAEKPSVAQDIARALGVPRADNGNYFENDDHLITSAIGHLIEIYDPATETEDHKKVKGVKRWSFESLPMLPPRFGLRPSKDAAERVRLIKKLARRADEVVNACDAGREGELIFHYLAAYLGLNQPVHRLWLQSMTQASIRAAFKSLRASDELMSLRAAAVARSEADWLVGINATQALTALNSKDSGGFNLTNAGRVQTPTLALLVERELRRLAHVPEPYWLHDVTFKLAGGEYQGRWMLDLGAKGGDPLERSKEWQQRIKDEKQAQRCERLFAGAGVEGEVSETSKERRVGAPKLFDLNSLQREANALFSLPARATLRAAQSLYERHKLLTYPRTESRYLPQDYAEVCGGVLDDLAAGGGPDGILRQAAAAARKRLDPTSKGIFDDSKVTDHFAIIPTDKLPDKPLPELEAKIYELVLRRFVAAFLPPAVLQETTRATVVDSQVYVTRGSVIITPGWYAAARSAKEDRVLPPLKEGERARAVGAELQAKETTPPGRYDDSTLLGAMQGADKLVEDSDIANVLSETGGLGTPATRAGIIEHLIANDYVARNEKELVPTRKAFSLLEILRGMEILELVQPNLTGEWERRLRRIEEGDEQVEPFLDDIRGLATRICKVAKTYDPDATPGDYATLKQPCPKCKGVINEQYRRYRCVKCKEFYIWKTIGGRVLSPAEADVLLEQGRVGPFEDFISRRGFPFAATIELLESGKANLLFASDLEDEQDPATLRKLTACPKKGCDGEVLVAASSFRCSKSFNGGDCDFKLGRTICSRELATDEVRPLFERRRSELLEGFLSRRGKKPFKAYLLLDDKGKLAFEFEKSEKKPAAKKKAAKKKKAAANKPAARKQATAA